VQVAHLPGPATICATLQHPVQVAHLPRPATFCKQPCKHPVQVAHLHTEMGQLWRQLRIQQQCLGSRPASTSMTRGYWEVPGSRRPALLSSRSSSESWLSVTLSFLMVPTFKFLPLPLPSCMHAMMFCTLHRSACLNVCNGLYLCTRMVLFFFYKNLLFGLTIFYFNCLCFFSGQTLYNGELPVKNNSIDCSTPSYLGMTVVVSAAACLCCLGCVVQQQRVCLDSIMCRVACCSL